MEGASPQIPVTQEVQSKAKEVSKTPQQPPVVSQVISESSPPAKPNKSLEPDEMPVFMEKDGDLYPQNPIWGDLPNDVRTHFITSEAEERVMLAKLLLLNRKSQQSLFI